jgi:uncharacterized membrane protein
VTDTDSGRNETGNVEARFLIRPNRSISKDGLVATFVGAFSVVLTIAVLFALMGAWLILPFAGLELGVFGGVLWWFYRHYDDFELVVVDRDQVRIVRRRGSVEMKYEFQRYWVRVDIDPVPHPWRTPRLFLRSHGNRVEFGSDLTGAERIELARHLKMAIAE